MVGAAGPSQDTGLYTVTGIPSTENTERFQNFRISETAVWHTLFLLNVSAALKGTHNYILIRMFCCSPAKIRTKISFLPQNVDEMANRVDPIQTVPLKRCSLIWVCSICPGTPYVPITMDHEGRNEYYTRNRIRNDRQNNQVLITVITTYFNEEFRIFC